MSRAILLLLLFFAPAAGAAWDGDMTRQLETGFGSRAHLRGVEQARAGAFAAWRLEGEAFRAEVAWHQSFRHRDEHLGALAVGYDVWKNTDGAAMELRATHRRLAAMPAGSRAAEHTTEVAVRLAAAPVQAWVPSISYGRDLRREADLIEARLSREFALTRWGAFLETAVFGGWNAARDVSPDRAGPAARDAYAYFGADARLPYRIGERSMLVLAAHVSSAHGASGAWSALTRASRTRAGVDLSVTFDF